MVDADRIGESQRSGRTDQLKSDTSLNEFFDPELMEEYTDFGSFDEFCEECPWEINAPCDIGQIRRAELDRHVRRTTRFDSWLAMQNRAAEREIYDLLLI